MVAAHVYADTIGYAKPLFCGAVQSLLIPLVILSGPIVYFRSWQGLKIALLLVIPWGAIFQLHWTGSYSTPWCAYWQISSSGKDMPLAGLLADSIGQPFNKTTVVSVCLFWYRMNWLLIAMHWVGAGGNRAGADGLDSVSLPALLTIFTIAAAIPPIVLMSFSSHVTSQVILSHGHLESAQYYGRSVAYVLAAIANAGCISKLFLLLHSNSKAKVYTLLTIAAVVVVPVIWGMYLYGDWEHTGYTLWEKHGLGWPDDAYFAGIRTRATRLAIPCGLIVGAGPVIGIIAILNLIGKIRKRNGKLRTVAH